MRKKKRGSRQKRERGKRRNREETNKKNYNFFIFLNEVNLFVYFIVSGSHREEKAV